MIRIDVGILNDACFTAYCFAQNIFAFSEQGYFKVYCNALTDDPNTKRYFLGDRAELRWPLLVALAQYSPISLSKWRIEGAWKFQRGSKSRSFPGFIVQDQETKESIRILVFLRFTCKTVEDEMNERMSLVFVTILQII